MCTAIMPWEMFLIVFGTGLITGWLVINMTAYIIKNVKGIMSDIH